MNNKYTLLIFILTLFAKQLFSQELQIIENQNNKLEHKIVAGFNIGATTPFPVPQEVRKVEAWWPQFGAVLGYNILYRDKGNWGIGAGILLDYKGMGVRDQVKYLYTTVDIERGEETGKFQGYFTGKNKTEVKNAYVTVPVFVTYYLKDKWRFRLGGYASYLFSSQFSGEVTDGYIREGDYTGRKIIIDYAHFNFGDEVRTIDLGALGGAEYIINKRFGVTAQLSYGFTPLFKSSFKGVNFKMHNIYANIGMTYTL